MSGKWAFLNDGKVDYSKLTPEQQELWTIGFNRGSLEAYKSIRKDSLAMLEILAERYGLAYVSFDGNLVSVQHNTDYFYWRRYAEGEKFISPPTSLSRAQTKELLKGKDKGKSKGKERKT